jgi:hypothetical protein
MHTQWCKPIRPGWLTLWIVGLLGGGCICGEARGEAVAFTGQDSVEVVLALDEPLVNGRQAAAGQHELVRVPGVGAGLLRVSRREIDLRWEWAEGVGGPTSRVLLPQLPAGEALTLVWSWDAQAGRMVEYVGGVPQRDPDTAFEPWPFPRGVTAAVQPGSVDSGAPVTVVSARRTSDAPDAERTVDPAVQRLLTTRAQPAALADVLARRGELLFAEDFDDPGPAGDPLPGWVLEGPVVATREPDGLVLRSSRPDAQRPEHGHVVIWAPVTLPDRFVAQWDFQVRSEHGLAIVFFAIHPNRPGIRDIFDPAMPPRDGAFGSYVGEALDGYHISYYANTPFNPDRGLANLRKNAGMLLMASGQLGHPQPRQTHRITLIHDDPRIQLWRDDQCLIDAVDDDPARFGLPHDGGRFGLRQMQWTTARYDNLRIHALGPE